MSELPRERVEQVIAALDRGETRVAERVDGEWRVNEEAQRAILEYFRMRELEPREVGPFEYHDKIPLKHGYEQLGVRVVPPATARYGAFLSPGVVLMPSYVNIGAWVGPNTMVDTWATVGSGAQIGADVHLAGGVGIGGVLEPPGARPVIVEDGAFVGSRAAIVEGVIVGEQAVIGPHVTLGATIPVIDVTGEEPVEHRGYVPPRAIVVPGTRPKEFPAGTYQFSGRTVGGEIIEGTGTLTHAIPAGPKVSATVGPGNRLVILWTAVTGPPPGFPNRRITIAGYHVIIGSFQVTVPAKTLKVTVPPEFVASLPSGANQFEVLAIEASGNQTITEGTFTK